MTGIVELAIHCCFYVEYNFISPFSLERNQKDQKVLKDDDEIKGVKDGNMNQILYTEKMNQT